jgi:type IV pilus assembly protein PilE
MANKGEQLMATAQRSPGVRARTRGFTLIELMVVVAIVGILVGIALPSYQDSVRKGRRGQAKSDLVELAQRAERFRTVNNTYAGFWASVPAGDKVSPRNGGGPFYLLNRDAGVDTAANTFVLTATPQASQTADTRCNILTLVQAWKKDLAGTHSGTVADCW